MDITSNRGRKHMDEKNIIDGLKSVCQCQGINQKVFLAHIASGMKTVAGLQKVTGAGSGSCQGKQCTPRIEHLLQSALGLKD